MAWGDPAIEVGVGAGMRDELRKAQSLRALLVKDAGGVRMTPPASLMVVEVGVRIPLEAPGSDGEMLREPMSSMLETSSLADVTMKVSPEARLSELEIVSVLLPAESLSSGITEPLG